MPRLPSRSWFRRVHLVLGLALGTVLIAVAGSGAALVFRDEIRALDPLQQALATAWDGKGDMGFAAARDFARAQKPDHDLQILWFPTDARPYYSAAYRSPEGKRFAGEVRFHPATGEILPLPQSPMLHWIEGFHVNLHLGAFGAFLVRWCTLLFSLLLLTGLYLWWPGLKLHLWFVIRGGRLKLWDAHRVLGFFASFPLLVMMISGVFFAFPQARGLLYLLTGDAAPAAASQDLNKLRSPAPAEGVSPVSDEALLAAARELSPPDAIVFYLTFPITSDEARQVRLQRGYSPWPYGEIHRVYFDQYSGNVLAQVKPDERVASRYLARYNSELHYGTIGGLATKLLWTAACALVPFFAITGILLWRRRTAKRVRAQVATPSPVTATSTTRLRNPREGRAHSRSSVEVET